MESQFSGGGWNRGIIVAASSDVVQWTKLCRFKQTAMLISCRIGREGAAGARSTPPGNASLPESREKFDPALKITCLIDHKTIKIKWLDTPSSARAAGSHLARLREAAGRICVGILHRFPIPSLSN